MPFYELTAIAGHYPQYASLRDLVRSTALHIMEHGGHVRKIESWGTQVLPERMTRHKINHTVGDYFFVQFDCSPLTLKSLNEQYRVDPRVIRWTNIKIGENIKNIHDYPAKTQYWGSPEAPSSSSSSSPAHALAPPSLTMDELRARATSSSTLASKIDLSAFRREPAAGSPPPRSGINQSRRDSTEAGAGQEGRGRIVPNVYASELSAKGAPARP